MNRKNFLKAMLLSGAGIAATQRVAGGQQPDSLSGRGETGTLRDPYSVGRPRDRATPADNDEAVKSIEQQLKCSCGCNLDIFTCRTTDFSCATSPALHQQVAGLYQAGFTEDQIIQQFVDQYGEQALMAPKPEGFNIAGYIVPGVVILLTGGLLALYLSRRRAVGVTTGALPPEGAGSRTGGKATPEELDQLRRAISVDEA